MPFGRFLLSFFLSFFSFFNASLLCHIDDCERANRSIDHSIPSSSSSSSSLPPPLPSSLHGTKRRRQQLFFSPLSPPSPPEALESVNWITHARRLIAGTIRLFFSFFLPLFFFLPLCPSSSSSSSPSFRVLY